MAATAQQILDALNDTILSLVTHGVGSYELGPNNIQYEYADLAKLRAMRSELQSEVAQTVGGRQTTINTDSSRRSR